MAKFINITPNLTINIDSIYSIEQVEIDNTPIINDWIASRDEIIQEFIKENKGYEFEFGDGIKYLIKEDINDYTKEEYDTLMEYVIDLVVRKIGVCPEQKSYNYVVILSTGVKVNISKKRFEEIKKCIL